ncbi:unnamed protein product [Pedinophyceae sp. YPF-701]|nr:unnamed protein product [Pedinophyceae sp. YPF-701]
MELGQATPRTELDAILSADSVDLVRLRQCLTRAALAPRCPHRSLTWKLLLGLLPPNRSAWEAEAKRVKECYAQYVQDVSRLLERPADGHASEHPLSTSDSSQWHAYFQFRQVTEEIQMDVDRTHSEDAWFRAQRPVMLEVLQVFALTNPGVGFVQGMAEILAAILFALAREGVQDLPAQAFSLTCGILGEVRDIFIAALDKDGGLEKQAESIYSNLARADPGLHAKLVRDHVDVRFFGIRWLGTLLTQTFDLEDVVMIWDAAFADQEGAMAALVRVCACILCQLRDDLMNSDFTAAVKLLQGRLSTRINISALLAQTRRLH